MTETRSAPTTHRRGKPAPAKGKGRTTPALFYRQVVTELRKVIWPSRRELLTYTAVALTFVLIMIAIVSALDFALGRAVLAVFG